MLAVVAIATLSKAQESGKIYFLRSTGFTGSATSFKAFIDKQIVCKVSNKSYSEHEVKPGEHQVDVQFSGKEYKGNDAAIIINVEAGKSYYVQMVIKTKFTKNDLYCQEVTESTAKVMMKELEKDANCF